MEKEEFSKNFSIDNAAKSKVYFWPELQKNAVVVVKSNFLSRFKGQKCLLKTNNKCENESSSD